jgi:aminoacrylate hydrolase
MPLTPSGLFYDVHEGPSREAATVVLSAGLGGSPAFFAPQMAALKARFRVLGYDHRGTGRSVHKLTKPHSAEAMATDVVEVLDAAGIERAHLVGHAAGGIAGLALALSAPERLGRLVAINAWAWPDPHIKRCFDVRLAILKDSGAAAYVHAQPLFLYPAAWISQNAARLEAEEAHHLAAFPDPAIVRARIEALLAFDIRDRLGEITAPVLLAASADDMLVPAACSERMAAALPAAALQVFPWGGHAFTVTAPDDFNAKLVAWLDGGT